MEKSENNSNPIDKLYSELCGSLRKAGKAASFCQLIKNVKTDLNRIDVLDKDCNIVPSLIKTLKKCRKNNFKDPQEARRIMESYDRKIKRSESVEEAETFIRLLNSAIVHLPVDNKFDIDQFDGLENVNGILALEKLLVDSDVDDAFESSDDSLLSDIYRERATCFHNLGNHKMAIVESLRAIRYGKFNKNKPQENLLSLLYSIATSLRHLKQWQAATNVLQLSIKLLRSSHLDNVAKSAETIKLVKLMKDIQIGAKGDSETRQIPVNLSASLKPRSENLPKIFGSISDTMTNASSSVQLKWDEGRGRHLIAVESIPPGSTLIIEEPFSWIVHPNECHSFCQNCCQEVSNLIPCSRCSTVVYCSEQCCRASERIHRYECDFMKMLTTSEILGDMALLCYRTISKMDIQSLESHVDEFNRSEEARKESPENEKIFLDKFLLGLDESLKLDSKNYCAVFAQTPNTDARLGGDLLKRTFAAILLTICLRLSGFFKSDEYMESDCALNETEELIACLFLRHLQSTSCNAYGIQKVNGANPRHLQEMEIGGATYPIVSTTNHSCNSNVYRFSVGKVCIVKALREIRCGEEILDSYGPHFASHPAEDRVRLLNGQYLFTCRCAACTENWALYSQLPRENPCLKCDKCETGFCTKKKDKFVCSSGCGNVIDGRKFLKTITDSARDYQAAKEMLLKGNNGSTIDYQQVEGSIVAHAKTLGRTQKWPCQALIECQETLKLCWHMQNSSSRTLC